jgi:hypothetical protein
LSFIPKDKEFTTLESLHSYDSLHFKINSSSLNDVTENAPQLIKDLSLAPYIENGMQLTLEMQFSDSTNETFSKEDILSIVNYLSDNEGCNALKIKGSDEEVAPISLDTKIKGFNIPSQ